MSTLSFSQSTGVKLRNKLAKYCQTLPDEFKQISKTRQSILQEIGDYIYEKSTTDQVIKFTVICTHNSRRSHMGQLWLEVAAICYGIDRLTAYSGGTEATAFNPRAVKALQRAGFEIKTSRESDNPIYHTNYFEEKANFDSKLFSKKYDDVVNPAKNFAALMVCSEAEAACPFVTGAEVRFALPFDDPKNYDDTPEEEEQYDISCRLIAREIFFAMQHTKKRLDSDLDKA